MMGEGSDTAKVADAVSEVAKTTSKAIDASSSVTSFLYRVFGEPLENLAGTYVSDPLKEFRKRRLSDLQLKTERHLSHRGAVDTKALPPPVAIPLLESASIETDEGLHDLWASLLAEFMDATRPSADRRLLLAMKALTPECVPALRLVWSKLQSALAKLSRDARGPIEMKEANYWADVHISEFADAGINPEWVSHLVSIGLLLHPRRERKAQGYTQQADYVVVKIEGEDDDDDRVRCSSLGLQFLEAVFR